MRVFWFIVILFLLFSLSCTKRYDYDVLIRGGSIYDGSGSAPYMADIGIRGDKIEIIGALNDFTGKTEIDASGLAAAPGFINMLSWATESLIEDGKSQSDIRQGVTLEVMGEGFSMGPLNEDMKKKMAENQKFIKYDIEWTTLGEYLRYLEQKGVSTNVASFIGASTARVNVLGYKNRAPSEGELEEMCNLIRQAMLEGALGVASALIYAPGFYAKTDELVTLAKTAAEYNGMYVSHIRSEGNNLLEALDEFLEIAEESGARSEIYHLKAAGKSNWDKIDTVIQKVETARKKGLHVTANMYTYTAGATGLNAAMPPWVQEGGHDKWVSRLKNPGIRSLVLKQMTTPTDKWENLLMAAGPPENVLLVGFKTDSLQYLTGKSLAEVSEIRGTPPAETAIDLVIDDDSRVETVFFLMSEENVQKQIKLPWVSFCSDAASLSPEGVFLKFNPHPRAYGNFARLSGKYVRENEIIPLEEAIRKLTSLPAGNLHIKNRGLLKEGYFADIVIFDPGKIQDHATYKNPHQYAAGVKHVFVNGIRVLKNGEHTGAKPGRFVKGPGWRK